MEIATIDSMCRCCAAEGIFKDIKTSYHWMGDEEVYGDMLRECFDVKLATVEEGGICEVCITQLRNAVNFKKQVLHTEKKFKKLLDNRRFKPTEVKEELSGDNGNSSDDNGGDSEDDEDYIPEFEIPIKTESPEESKSRKRAAKATTSRSKKSRVADDEDKSKQELARVKPEFDKPNPEELQKQRRHLRQILLSTNATPIRRHTDMGYGCGFCAKCFPKPADLKKHTIGFHDAEMRASFMNKTCLSRLLVKLDVTDLECNICSESIDSFAEVAEHLRAHGKLMHSDIKNYIIPFKFDDGLLKCSLCFEVHRKFLSLQIHMYGHYRNFVCHVCSAGFINQQIAYKHYINCHKIGCFPCSFCAEIFDTVNKKKNHEHNSHDKPQKHKCGYCDEMFKSFEMKRLHQISEHDIKSSTFDCTSCSKQFSKPSLLGIHIKKDHLNETRFKCFSCDKAFFFKYQLDTHEISHTRSRGFKCEICDKLFSRMKTLREHVKIHADERRFRCKICDAAFVQKVSLKNHLQKIHNEVLDY